jgi:magnesium-transporting ATPase (P-type)
MNVNSSTGEESIKKDLKWGKISKIVLIFGLVIVNTIFIVYCVYIIKAASNDIGLAKNRFVTMEMICWSAGILSSLMLIGAITYTIIKLK